MLVAASILYFSFEHKTDPFTGGGDAKTYFGLAHTLLEEHVYQETWPENAPFRAWRPPLWPAFLAFLIWF